VANNENLIPFNKRTVSEQRKIQSAGGRASGEARRRKADFRKTLNMLLTTEIDSEEWKPVLEALGVECTLESALNMAMIKEGLAGNVKAYEAVARYAGQSGQTDADLEEQSAKIQLMQAQKEKVKKADPVSEGQEGNSKAPHDVIIPELWDIFDDQDHEHQIITSGRAGTKSSFAGILGISTITCEEPAAVVVLRKRHNKLRKTVYKEMIRAIGRLGLSKDDFDIGVSPMEIRHKKTGNVIYFSGSDSIDDTKGIIDEDKPIRLVILDELTEFFDVGEGEEELTNIEATFVRGNDESFRMLYLYNPPKNPNAPVNVWCQKMELRSDVVHKHIDYRDVPVSWLGKKLLESAELLKNTDYRLYRWVWLGECIGVDDLIYYMFNDNHRQEPEAKYYKLIGIGVDYGQQNATTYQAAGVNINKRRIEGINEFYHSGRDSGKQKSPSDYAKELIKFTDALHEEYSCSAFYVFIDPSAKGLAEEIKRLAMQSRKYGIVIKDAENDVAVGIQRVQKCLTYQVMTISERQENLIREMGTYEYDPKSIESGKEKPMKVDDHCCDAWRYLVMGLWSKIKYFLPDGERGEND
jgi:phage terminase large subunit